MKIVAVNETALSICGLSRKDIGEQISALATAVRCLLQSPLRNYQQ